MILHNLAAQRAFAVAATAALGVITLSASSARALPCDGAEHQNVICTHYPSDNDLLTAGLGKTGLAGSPPPVSTPPTTDELRRLAIFNNYRALVDVAPAGGYGVLYGPNIDADGNDTGTEGKIPGRAHHLDAFNSLTGFNELFIPLHRYFIQALDLMYAHLKTNAPLPPSQVVRTTPRGPGAPQFTKANVPPISHTPESGDLITFTPGRLFIPD